MNLERRPEQNIYALDTGGGYVEFDEIESTGRGYWELKKDSSVVMKLRTLEELSSEDVALFRDIQFGRI